MHVMKSVNFYRVQHIELNMSRSQTVRACYYLVDMYTTAVKFTGKQINYRKP